MVCSGWFSLGLGHSAASRKMENSNAARLYEWSMTHPVIFGFDWFLIPAASPVKYRTRDTLSQVPHLHDGRTNEDTIFSGGTSAPRGHGFIYDRLLSVYVVEMSNEHKHPNFPEAQEIP